MIKWLIKQNLGTPCMTGRQMFYIMRNSFVRDFKSIQAAGQRKKTTCKHQIGIHSDDFDPCDNCKKQQDNANRHNPVTHCLKCVPVVTHTKQGICVLVKYKKEKTLIMDFIPVLPAPPTDSLMSFYALIITSLLREKPLGLFHIGQSDP